MRCEDYPCCGHTNDDPCDPQPYDRPDYFDTSVNPHALCEHEYGICDVEPEDEDACEYDEQGECYVHDYAADEYDYYGGEDAYLDGSWEE